MPVSRPAFSYRLLSFTLLPIWFFHAAWQALKNHQLEYLWQRSGFFPDKECKQQLWIHASSVGEIELIKPLVLSLHKDQAI